MRSNERGRERESRLISLDDVRYTLHMLRKYARVLRVSFVGDHHTRANSQSFDISLSLPFCESINRLPPVFNPSPTIVGGILSKMF